MSPAKGKRGSPKRKRRRGLPIVLVLLGIVAAGVSGLALYFGFLPGPDSLLGARRAASLPDDSALASRMAAGGAAGGAGASDAPAVDTTRTAAGSLASAADSGSVAVGVAVTAADSAAGDFVYHGTGRCVGCHGATGEGAPGLGPSLRVSPGRLGDGSVAALARVIAGGAPPSSGFRIAMPSYAGQLSADDVTRVASYVHTLSHPGATADSARVPVPADPAAGAVNADAPVRRPTVPAPPRP